MTWPTGRRGRLIAVAIGLFVAGVAATFAFRNGSPAPARGSQAEQIELTRAELKHLETDLAAALDEGWIDANRERRSALILAAAAQMLACAERRADRDDITDILEAVNGLIGAADPPIPPMPPPAG